VIGKLEAQPRQSPAASEGFWESEIRPKALSRFIYEHPAIRWGVRPLPALPILQRRLPEILEDFTDNNTAWWSEERVEYLISQMSPRHRAVADAMLSRQAWSYGTIFRRIRKERSMAELRTDGVAGCLRTPRGGSGRQILLKAGFGVFWDRLLSAG
jgi:DNA (cytosine-5)-methyltransferase 1